MHRMTEKSTFGVHKIPCAICWVGLYTLKRYHDKSPAHTHTQICAQGLLLLSLTQSCSGFTLAHPSTTHFLLQTSPQPSTAAFPEQLPPQCTTPSAPAKYNSYVHQDLRWEELERAKRSDGDDDTWRLRVLKSRASESKSTWAFRSFEKAWSGVLVPSFHHTG